MVDTFVVFAHAPHSSATRCIQQTSRTYLNTVFGRCQTTKISNCRAYEATYNGETSYTEEGIHTHLHSDHIKFKRRYEAAESMIKLLLVARANFGYLLVNLSGCHVPRSARGS